MSDSSHQLVVLFDRLAAIGRAVQEARKLAAAADRPPSEVTQPANSTGQRRGGAGEG